ncbi:MAG: tyrosine-type recombinase/integrase [Gemmataceae bacterium]
MAHHPKPAYRASRNLWFVEVDKQQVPLGKHPEGLPPPKKKHTAGGKRGEWDPPKAVLDEYHRVMAELGEQGKGPLAAPARRPGEVPSVAEVLDEFLTWLSAQPHKAERTVGWYRKFLQSFLDSLDDQLLPVDLVSPRHVTAWLNSHPGWTTGRRGAIVAVQRAFNYSAKEGLLQAAGLSSPLSGMEKPPQGRREQLVSAEEFSEILRFVKDQEFRDLVEAAWATGARPHELFTVEASFVDWKNGRWVFPVRLSKGKRVQRVVYLSERMVGLTRRLSERWAEGPLFRNSEGKPWRQSSVKCRFQRLRRAMGLDKADRLGLLPPKVKRLTLAERADPAKVREHADRAAARRRELTRRARRHGTMYPLYAFRHSFCTRALVEGADAVTVSVLMSHKDTTMISRHYAHLAQRPGHLRDVANRLGGAGGS